MLKQSQRRVREKNSGCGRADLVRGHARGRHGQRVSEPQAKHAQRDDKKPDACLQQTSLYFTCIANGNSQMYHSSD
ncbi:MAG TPA: hypothetical protein VF492_09920, partial [Verrucomicrobiae bacterium]